MSNKISVSAEPPKLCPFEDCDHADVCHAVGHREKKDDPRFFTEKPGCFREKK